MVRQGSRGHRREREGMRRSSVCGGVVQLVRTPVTQEAAADPQAAGIAGVDIYKMDADGTAINKAGRIGGHGFTLKVIWAIVKANAQCCGLPSVAPHDLRSCARLRHQAGGELDQIQFLLGHVSIQTTERYLGCKQRFRDAVNDHIGLEPDAPS